MPHIVVKMISGRTDEQKARLAEEVTKAVMSALNCAEKSVSVAVEDVASADWTEKVYKPDILAKPDQIFKAPGYEPS
jgi:4-oxalocrotonate tautomerase